MTAKEKASEMIVEYQLQCKSLDYQEAKQCALIAVEEVINNINQNLINNTILYNRQLMYWLNVKQEIEKS
jgi:hypothetical protein